MTDQDNHASLDTLLNLDGQTYFMGEKGHSVRFDVKRTPITRERPHGLKYSLTVHAPDGMRIAGFDNAHGVRASAGPAGKRMEYDHKHRFRTVLPYDYINPVALMEDFWKLAESVLMEEGVTL